MYIQMYSKTGCPYCEMAAKFFDENEIEFIEYKLDDTKERLAFYESCGKDVKTVPQIFIDGDRIGGYEELMEQKNDIISRHAIEFIEENNINIEDF